MKKIEFKNNEGQKIAGRLEIPETGIKDCAIFAHCFTCSKDVVAASRISKALRAKGFAVLRFDFTGLGNSEGDFANSNFSSNISDLVSAAHFLTQNYSAPKLLIGHSLGGAAVLAAASNIESVQAVVTIGVPSDVAHVANLFVDDIKSIEQRGEARVELAGQSFTIKKQFIDDVKNFNLQNKIANLHKALLIFHSPQDNIVSIENAKDIYLAAKHPKSFVSLDGADHMLSDKVDSQYVAEVIASWSERYVSADQTYKINDQSFQSAGAGLAKGEMLVRSLPNKKFTQEVLTASHRFLMDEPFSVGGDNLGVNPYEALMAALGSCTSMTMLMYAQHKGWPLVGIEVKLHHNKIYAKDCEDCESPSGKIDLIHRMIKIRGSQLDDAQKSKLMEIADKCPVHKSLHSEVKIETESWTN